MNHSIAIPLKVQPVKETTPRDGVWMAALRGLALLVLTVMPAVIVLVPFGRQLFWTVMIAVLPLFFTAAGFHSPITKSLPRQSTSI